MMELVHACTCVHTWKLVHALIFECEGGGQRSTLGIFLYCSLPCFVRQGLFLTGSEYYVSARLDGQ